MSASGLKDCLCSNGDIIQNRVRWYKQPIRAKAVLDDKEYVGFIHGQSLNDDAYYWMILDPGQGFPSHLVAMIAFPNEEEKKLRRLRRWVSTRQNPFSDMVEDFVTLLGPQIERL